MPPMSKSNNSKIELIIFLPNLFLHLLFFIFWLIASIAHQVPKLETLDSFGASFSFFPLTVPQSNATQQSLCPYPPPYIFAFYKVLSSPQSILNHPIFATLPCVIILVQAMISPKLLWLPLLSGSLASSPYFVHCPHSCQNFSYRTRYYITLHF